MVNSMVNIKNFYLKIPKIFMSINETCGDWTSKFWVLFKNFFSRDFIFMQIGRDISIIFKCWFFWLGKKIKEKLSIFMKNLTFFPQTKFLAVFASGRVEESTIYSFFWILEFFGIITFPKPLVYSNGSY